MSVMTEEQRLFFETNGYLVIENALTREELERVREASDRAEATWRSDPARLGERDFTGVHVQAMMEYDDILFDLIEHPKVFPLIREVMGPDISMIDHDYLRTAAGSGGQGGWHHDVGLNGIFHPFSVLMVKAFFLLSDVSEEDGPTLFLPGSHRYPMEMPLPKVETAEDMPGHVKMAYPAGTAYFFNGRLYHSAGSQRGTKDRRVLIYNYGHKWMRIWQGYEPSPELQSRARTPLRRQLLGMTNPYGYDAD